MKDNKEKLSKTEYEGYEKQYAYVKQVMTKFDDPKYDDEDKTSKAELVEVMQKVHSESPNPRSSLDRFQGGS